MAITYMEQSRRPSSHLHVRSSNADALIPEPPPPLPLYHHPVIAISIILAVASLVQIAVWFVAVRLTPVPVPSSAVIAYEIFFPRWNSGEPAQQSGVFTACLLLAMLSGVVWYAAARLALSRPWGLWAGVLWVAHPAFAFLAQRPSPLILLITLLPLTWAFLLWWNRRRRRWIAWLAGVSLGAVSLFSLLGILLLPLMLAAMALNGRPKKRWSGVALATVGFLMGTAPLLAQCFNSRLVDAMRQQLAVDLWQRLRSEDGSMVAGVVAEQPPPTSGPHIPSPLGFLARQARATPGPVARWYANRLWESTYATAAHTLQLPLLVLHGVFLLPAAWGYIVALRYCRWRWMAMTAGSIAGVVWLLAALAEPLARNLTPVGGFAVLFALVGVADVYERLFGRRLIEEQSDIPSSEHGDPGPIRHRPR